MHFKKTQKKFFVNNFCAPKLKTLKFLTQNETMVMQISAALSSPNFHSGKSYAKKISVYFLVICANCLCKIEKFESKVVGVGILGTEFCFQGSHYH